MSPLSPTDFADLPPGSDEALKHGCKCPVLDNAHGKGYMCVPGIYVYSELCPVHWAAAVKRMEAKKQGLTPPPP